MRKFMMIITLFLVGILSVPSSMSFIQGTSSSLVLTEASSPSTNRVEETLASIRSQRLWDVQHPSFATTGSGLYHTYQEMTDLFIGLAQNHSDIMSLTSLGKTYEGRDLWLVKLSDNVTENEDEPEVLFMGAHHGNEKPSYEILIYFIQYMIENYQNNTAEVLQAINTTEIYLIPMVNPDGVEAGTRKNRDPNHGWFGLKEEETSIGVDLNRNYGYRWMFLFLLPRLYLGSTDLRDTSEVYRGQRPFSEVETQAVRTFVDTHEITLSITYHTYGELILYPWGHSPFPPKDKPVFVSIGENISAINNYTLGQSIELYPTLGDACDWMYGRHGILAYTIELGESYAPGNPEVLQEMSERHTQVNLYMCDRAQDL